MMALRLWAITLLLGERAVSLQQEDRELGLD